LAEAALRTIRSGFGFSWSVVVSPRKSPRRGLDFLGFPWILSSESILFNGLRGFFVERIFSRALRCRAAPKRAPVALACRGSFMGASLLRFLLFRKRLLPDRNCLVAPQIIAGAPQ
jgi:hypothetical protein